MYLITGEMFCFIARVLEKICANPVWFKKTYVSIQNQLAEGHTLVS